MEAVNALFQRSLTLPTGAKNPTPRIVEDGTTSTILVYGTGGSLIASIAATAGTDGLGNNYPAGISATAGVISQSVFLLYNGTPAAGNLILSMAAAAGADSFGNAYVSGVGTYSAGTNTYHLDPMTGNVQIGTSAGSHWLFDVPNTEFTLHDRNNLLTADFQAAAADSVLYWLFNSSLKFYALGQGLMRLGTLSVAGAQPTIADQLNAAFFQIVSGTNPTLEIGSQSNTSGSGSAWVTAQLKSGNASGTLPGQTGNPVFSLYGPSKSSTDLALYKGALYRGDLTGQQAPSYNANWSASTTFNGSSLNQPLDYCIDGMDNLVFNGGFKTGAVAGGAVVFNVPAPYRPKNNQWITCWRNNGGVISSFGLQITTGGNVNIVATMGGGIAVNNEYWVEACPVPLGNLP